VISHLETIMNDLLDDPLMTKGDKKLHTLKYFYTLFHVLWVHAREEQFQLRFMSDLDKALMQALILP
jgi:hypothetical protein